MTGLGEGTDGGGVKIRLNQPRMTPRNSDSSTSGASNTVESESQGRHAEADFILHHLLNVVLANLPDRAARVWTM